MIFPTYGRVKHVPVTTNQLITQVYLPTGHLWGFYVGIHIPAPWIIWFFVFFYWPQHRQHEPPKILVKNGPVELRILKVQIPQCQQRLIRRLRPGQLKLHGTLLPQSLHMLLASDNKKIDIYPIGSMYGTFCYIYRYLINGLNVGKYSTHGAYGYQKIILLDITWSSSSPRCPLDGTSWYNMLFFFHMSNHSLTASPSHLLHIRGQVIGLRVGRNGQNAGVLWHHQSWDETPHETAPLSQPLLLESSSTSTEAFFDLIGNKRIFSSWPHRMFSSILLHPSIGEVMSDSNVLILLMVITINN